MTRPAAPEHVLAVRAVGGLAIVSLYVVVRVPQLTSVPEAIATWFGAALCLWLVLCSVEELWQRAGECRTPAPVWPDEIELAIAEARHAAMATYVDRGEITEQLFTHDILCEPTPPRGFTIPPVIRPDVEQARKLVAAFEEKHGYVGRHRATIGDDTAAALLGRDRSGQLFGQL